MLTMKSTVETGPFLEMVSRMIRAAGRRVAMTDLEDFVELVAMQETLTAAIQCAVDGLRDEGTTWDDIGAALGISRQAAILRYANSANRGHKR